MFHHVELWVPDLNRAVTSWGWLLERLGCVPYQSWPEGRSWRHGDTYVVVEHSPALRGDRHDRLCPGLNHLAFRVPSRPALDALVMEAPAHGWTLLFPDRHPYAGGAGHYAAYLENVDGFEVELVAEGRRAVAHSASVTSAAVGPSAAG
ncbi:VOC family protein [Streptomyces sp. NBC_00576]|uniref:VOC family protein n=1 Tax=Streptomyces sp. NBC_00576 TaxID=2903665 RepID=UPI002E811F6D|nr:VOC family protein [Streptomyces sp. NBC_00576]WUB71298.1 VOC family protein [Streptomyces sp. NBC_00576]